MYLTRVRSWRCWGRQLIGVEEESVCKRLGVRACGEMPGRDLVGNKAEALAAQPPLKVEREHPVERTDGDLRLDIQPLLERKRLGKDGVRLNWFAILAADRSSSRTIWRRYSPPTWAQAPAL